MKAFLASLVLATFATVALAGLSFYDCGSQYRVRSIDIENCNKTPCNILVEQLLNVSTEFHADFDSDHLKPEPEFYVNNGLFKGITKDPCPRDCCTVKAGQTCVYSANVTVNEDLPPVRGVLRWILKNEKNVNVVCVAVDVLIYWYDWNGKK